MVMDVINHGFNTEDQNRLLKIMANSHVSTFNSKMVQEDDEDEDDTLILEEEDEFYFEHPTHLI